MLWIVFINFSATAKAATWLRVTNRWGGFFPLIPADTSRVSFLSIFLLVYLLKIRSLYLTFKMFILQGVSVPKTLDFWLLQEQCTAWRVLNKALRWALCKWGSPKWSIILLDWWRILQCFKQATWLANNLHDLYYKQQTTKEFFKIYNAKRFRGYLSKIYIMRTKVRGWHHQKLTLSEPPPQKSLHAS